MIIVTPEQARVYKERGAEVVWEPNPIQVEALVRREFEVCFGGSKGSSKTDCGIMWLIIGNIWVPDEKRTPTDVSYIHNPNYRALVLRKNQKDLGEWVDRTRRRYKAIFGDDVIVRDRSGSAEFEWASGAKAVIGHLADADAYEKYQGQEFQRMLIEELTQIPSYEQYSMVIANCRSNYEGLHPQVFLTTNPGGPGMGWVRDRFVRPFDKNGKLIPPKTPIVEEVQDPFTRKTHKVTRVFVPALPTDNVKMLEKDPAYVARMAATLTPTKRRAWIMGDWDALSGVFFDEFRPSGPQLGDDYPETANHVISANSVPQAPWWPKWAAGDWGYAHESAIYVACQHPSEQVHVYKELVTNRTTPEELGTEVARFLMPDIDSQNPPQMTLWLSHDAFGKNTEERTIADQMASGVEKVLGQNSVYIPDLADLPFGGSSPFARRDRQFDARLVIRRCQRINVATWQHVRALLRWWPTLPPATDKLDMDYAMSLLRDTTDGLDKYRAYLKMFEVKQETLPRLQIWDSCPRLIDAFPRAMAGDPDRGEDPNTIPKKHFRGRDSLDALAHLCIAHQTQAIQEPFEEFFRKRMEWLQPDPGNATVWAARKAEQDYQSMTHVGPISVRRASSRLRQRVN